MRQHRRLALFALSLLAFTPPLTAGLQTDIEAAIHASGLSTRQVSVAVRRCGHDRLVAGVAASTPRMPASNQKVLSSGLAARVLGPEFRFETRLLQRGEDLLVAGDGDPALGDDELLQQMQLPGGGEVTAVTLLDLWAAAAREAGVTHVRTLIVDDRVFDRDWRPEGWPSDQIQRWYCAPVAGLNFSCNTMSFRPTPASGGVDVSDAWPPWGDLRIDNDLKRGQRGTAKHVIHGSSTPDGRTIRLTGTVTQPTVAPVEINVENPPLRFGHMLAARLRLIGITVDAVRLADADDPPSVGRDIAPPIVTPISRVLDRCNQNSYNLYAEALLKRSAHHISGRPATWTDAQRLLTRSVEQVAGEDTGLHVEDGSGMSRLNAISTRSMTAWLCDFDPDVPADAAFISSLPEPGTGSLRSRFRNTDLHGASLIAKTGYIRGVYALSGYITCPDGTRFAFSILINGTGKGTSAKRLHETIVSLIARSGCSQ